MSGIVDTMSNHNICQESVSEPVVVARNLRKSFGDVQAVRDLSLAVNSGQVAGLLGPNGAGKTTTINMLTTLISIEAGSACIGGFDVATQPNRVRERIGLAGQTAAVDEKLTARENLELFCRLYKIPKEERKRRVAELIEQFNMVEFADRVASTYSGGERRRLDVVAALVADPPALFLDEPTTGLDPRSRAELWGVIRGLADRGTAIVLTTQYLEEADQLADEILIIDKGQVIASGTPEQLKRELQQDVLEIHVADGELDHALDLIGEVDGLTHDPNAGSMAIPVGQDVPRSLNLLRRLQDDGVTINDFQLRRPTLDDVFLSLTGAPADREEVSA